MKDQDQSTISSATSTLQSLLEQDPLLKMFLQSSNQVMSTESSEDVNDGDMGPVFRYAASLISSQNDKLGGNGGIQKEFSKSKMIGKDIQENAKEALSDVDRKLSLVQSLAEHISKEKPQHVAAPLLQLHGYTPYSTEEQKSLERGDLAGGVTPTASNSVALSQTLERCERLSRQAHVLDSVANRVETTLVRGLDRMSHSTQKLERVLQTSQVLKMILRLQFETKKVLGSGLNFEELCDENNTEAASHVDLRDLTRAAASVAVMEELLQHPELNGDGIRIDVVEKMRPTAAKISKAVRRAAAGLLAEQHSSSNYISQLPSATKLGATLEVYYHLGELPDAVWNAVSLALEKAEKASGQFLNPSAIKRLVDSVKSEAKTLADKEVSSLKVNDKKKKAVIYERFLKTKSRDLKASVVSKWATSVSGIALQVWQLHRVLRRKSDPTNRQNFLDVVQASNVPEKFSHAQNLMDSNAAATGESRILQDKKISLFSIFWNQMCINLGARIKRLMNFENGVLVSDVASMYPSVRAAALEMLTSVQEIMHTGSMSTSNGMDDLGGYSSRPAGILGGSWLIENDSFFNDVDKIGVVSLEEHEGAGALGTVSADTWTKKDLALESYSGIGKGSQPHTTSVISSILSSKEWNVLIGFGEVGLYPMQKAFLVGVRNRLQTPLKIMFVENRVVDENGIDIKMLPNLPTMTDLKNLEETFRNELAVADPREGGGEFSMSTTVSEYIVDTIEVICSLAQGASSGISERNFFHESKGTVTGELLHDMKVAGVLASITSSLRNLPELTFISPYRPAHSLQHEEAANMCEIALLPAIHEIESFVQRQLLTPLCNVINRKLALEIGRMHRGAHVEISKSNTEHLGSIYEELTKNVLFHLPTEYCGMVASTVCAFSIYCFVTNATLIRPLGEAGRLQITQDLADFELILEQLIFKCGGSIPLNQINMGKPYAELRAVRQMLFWNGLDDPSMSSEAVSKALFREVWLKDVRPSTVFHFLFSFAPSLLSSPHHANRMTTEEYVHSLVKLDGTVEDGEGKAWVTTMSCCDSYHQRESINKSSSDGDRRIPSILMIIGPELMRRRRF